jgi:hypothetical protein
MPPGSGPSAGAAEQLRQRATQLRTTASKLDSALALDLYRRAGDDVWSGPTPARCQAELLEMRAELQRAAVDLRDLARTLEQRAEQLDMEARTNAVAAGTGAG